MSNGYGYFFWLGKNGHMVTYFPMIKTQDRENNQPQASVPSFEASKRNHFYALKYSGDQEFSPILLLVCCKSFKLMYMRCLIPVPLYIL